MGWILMDKTEQEIIRILNQLQEGASRKSEFNRSSLRKILTTIKVHMIDGLEHRAIDKKVFPENDHGKGAYSSRLLYAMGIKGKEKIDEYTKKEKSIYLGIFKKKNLLEIIDLLKQVEDSQKNKSYFYFILNLYQIAYLINSNEEYRNIFDKYSKVFDEYIASKKGKTLSKKDSINKIELDIRNQLKLKMSLEEIKSLLLSMKEIITEGNELMESIILHDEINVPNADFRKLSIIERESKPTRKKVSKEKNKKKRSMTKRDYIAQQQIKQNNGDLAENLVYEHELKEVRKMGKNSPEEYVKHVALKEDGLGYDIESIDKNGNVKYIEVKGTSNTSNVDFPITAAEVEFSKQHADYFYIYRVYDLASSNPKCIIIEGSVEENFELKPIIYSAKLK